MITRFAALRIALILFSFFTAYRVVAQPTLPDITGSFEKGTVILTWDCQYSGVKGISVLRSADSVSDYEVIGFVKKMGKGIQSYTDTHPANGKNFYKLAIVFSSGLTWRSNHFGIRVSGPESGSGKPQEAADSAQKYLNTKTEKTKPVTKIEKESDLVMPKNKPADIGHTKAVKDTCSATSRQKPKPSVSIGSDTSATSAHVLPPAPPRPKIVMKFNGQPDTDDPVFIKSKYVFVDSATGHVDMFLPDDVATHRYSIKFYDRHNHAIMEVPKINTSKIIFDKRNFQREGVYKFILRRDYTELESGYIIIDF